MLVQILSIKSADLKVHNSWPSNWLQCDVFGGLNPKPRGKCHLPLVSVLAVERRPAICEFKASLVSTLNSVCSTGAGLRSPQTFCLPAPFSTFGHPGCCVLVPLPPLCLPLPLLLTWLRVICTWILPDVTASGCALLFICNKLSPPPYLRAVIPLPFSPPLPSYLLPCSSLPFHSLSFLYFSPLMYDLVFPYTFISKGREDLSWVPVSIQWKHH